MYLASSLISKMRILSVVYKQQQSKARQGRIEKLMRRCLWRQIIIEKGHNDKVVNVMEKLSFCVIDYWKRKC
jgi:hypothetical protein